MWRSVKAENFTRGSRETSHILNRSKKSGDKAWLPSALPRAKHTSGVQTQGARDLKHTELHGKEPGKASSRFDVRAFGSWKETLLETL